MLAVATLAVVGGTVPVLIVLLTFGAWVTPTRVTRGLARRLRGADHVQAAIGLGASDGRIIRRHVLPAVLPANLIVWTLTVGTLILIEGGLSFLGLGVRPPDPVLGRHAQRRTRLPGAGLVGDGSPRRRADPRPCS